MPASRSETVKPTTCQMPHLAQTRIHWNYTTRRSHGGDKGNPKDIYVIKKSMMLTFSPRKKLTQDRGYLQFSSVGQTPSWSLRSVCLECWTLLGLLACEHLDFTSSGWSVVVLVLVLVFISWWRAAGTLSRLPFLRGMRTLLCLTCSSLLTL